MKITEQIVNAIKKAKSIIIFHHVAADGDSLGSALGLKEMIEQLGTATTIDAVITGETPEIYNFLPHIKSLKNIKDDSLLRSYDLAITVDCACKDRLGIATSLFNSSRSSINIDHHISNEGFADIDFIIDSASSAGEVVYDLVKPMGTISTKSIATNLYTAILTDTGGFKFENTKPKTLQIASELIAAGADSVDIYKHCYESKPIGMVKLHARAIDNAVFLKNDQIVYTLITNKLLEDLNSSNDHVDGITETLRQIETIKIALVFKETLKGSTKVSFRSNGIDVCALASYFGGGGHKLAAGCLINKNIEESVNDVMSLVTNQFNKAQTKIKV